MNETVFTLGDALRLTLELDGGRFGLRPQDLFALAVRQNAQRSFLFVSKVLGKHLPIHPAAMLAAGRLLAMAYRGDPEGDYWAGLVTGQNRAAFSEVTARLDACRYHLPAGERTLFIGFAETATGLARAVADCFDGEMAYLSTTRLELEGELPLTFDESHSHARTHLLHLDPGEPFLSGCQRVVLIDDELTTGNTALRLIRELHRVYGIRRFTLMALQDNSSGENRRALGEELGIQIDAVSLLRGRIASVEAGPLPALTLDERCGTPGAGFDTLRFPSAEGLTDRRLLTAQELASQRAFCQRAAEGLREIPPEDTLYLGCGELIYAPALIAGHCGGSCFHSTTQSPVYPLGGSAIVSGVHFDPPDCYSPTGYLYNVPQGRYRRVVLMAEAATAQEQGLRQLAAYLTGRGAERVTVVLL